MQRLKSTFRQTRAQHPPGAHRIHDPLQFYGAQVSAIEKVTEQSTGRFAYDHGAGVGHGLEAGGEVRSLSGDAALLRLARPGEIADYDDAGSDPDPSLEWLRARRRQLAHRLDGGEAARTARSASSSCACG